MIRVEIVKPTAGSIQSFIRLPDVNYHDDPNYVALPRRELTKL